MSCAEDMGVGNAAVQSGIDGECEILNQGDADVPSPSIIASRSFAIEKSPSVLTAVTFGSGGMVRCSPGGNAWRQILDSFPRVCKRETIRGTFWSGGEVCVL